MIEHPWPRFTKEGFKKTRVPDDLYLDMAVAYNQARFTDIQQDYYYEEHYGHSVAGGSVACLLYTSPSPRDGLLSRMPSSA